MKTTSHFPNTRSIDGSGMQNRMQNWVGRNSDQSGSSSFLRSMVQGIPKSFHLAAKLLTLVLFFQAMSGCVSIVYFEGNYRGKVIDAETLQPIQGAVVLGVWSKGYHGAGGVAHEYYDARETTTDEHGEFTINGMGPRAITHLEKMDVVIFKAGYEEVGRTSWEALRNRQSIKWEGNKAIISLAKWPREGRQWRLDPSITTVPIEKQKKLIEEIKRDKKMAQ